MKKSRPFFLALAGGLAATLAVPGAWAQNAVQIAAVGAPTELASTPAPDADAKEKSPPTDTPPGKDEITETDIDASISATFNSKDRVAVFTGNVKVVDPRFQLVCDKLTVFLNKPAPTGQNAAATPAPTPAAAPGGKAAKSQAPGGGGIDHALAEGHVVILQKKAATQPGEEEKVSIGRGQTATFDNKSGDMVLRGWPSLEQNGSSVVATASNTVMTIDRDNNLHTEGPNKTKLIQRGKGGSAFELPGAPSVPTNERRQGGGRRGAAPVATPASGAR